MKEQESLKQLKRRLDAIGRLRLLTESDEELSTLVEHRVDEKNGLGRLGGRSLFLKQATYDALCRYANERANHDFDQFLTDYEVASAFYEKYQLEALMRKDREETCSQLLDTMYGNDGKCQMTDADPQLARIFNKVYGEDRNRFAVNPQVLVLMVLGLLPADFSRSRGRVGNLLEDFRSLFRFLHRHVGRNDMFERLPILERYEERLLDGSDPHARFWLYDDMADVLENYYDIMNMEQRMAKNRELRERSLWPPLDGSVWKEHDDCVWWLWEEVSNGFFLHRIVVDHAHKRLTREKFELFLYDECGDAMAYAVHPKSILSIVEGKPVPPGLTENLLLTWDDEKKPTQLEFASLIGYHWFPAGKLHICQMNAEAFWKKHEGYELVERHPETTYDFRIGIAAITPEAVFITADECTFYRIPLSANDALRQVCIDDPAGVMTFQQSGRRFVTFTDLNLFFEVTTKELCRRQDIEVVTDIL